MENYTQQLTKHVRSGQNPIAKVAKRIGETSRSAATIGRKKKFTRIGTFAERFQDSCFMIGDKYAFVREKRDGGRVLCDVLCVSQVESFFCSPADSKLFNIVYARSIEHRTKRRLMD